MEFVEGQTLKEYLKNRGGRIAADEAVELLKPIIKAMAQVHRVGIIHRDISPENIMITPSGSAKLIDFGSVRLSEDEYKSSAVQLKPGYAPPEQYSSDGDQGAWTDVYALCATLYRAVTGTTPTASIERMKGAALKTLSEAGADILPIRDRAIMVGLELDHNKRFNNMDALGNALSVEAPYERQINNTDASSVNGTAASSADDDSKGYINDITTKQVHNNTVAKGALSPVFIAIIAALSVLIIALIALIAVFAIKGNSTTRKNNTSESLVYTESVTPAPTPAPTAIPAPEFEHVSGSSTRGSDTSSGKEINYYIDYIRDGDYTTAWSSDRNIELTPTVIFSSETKQHVTGIRIANGYFKSEETYRKNRRITKILITHDGGSQEASLNTDSYRVMQDIRLNTPVDTSFVSIKVLESLSGEWKDIAISEISIY
jgi:serine/threonine protein kinase